MINKTPWIVLLILWMIGSTWWHVCTIKQLCANNAPPAATVGVTPPGADGFTIADGNRFRLELPGNFNFAKSGANVNLNTLGGSLESMVAYLKAQSGRATIGRANPGRTTIGRSLEVIGYYSADETNTTSFPNLGLARAEAMKQYLVQQGVPTARLTTKGVERRLPYTAKGDSLTGGLDFVFGGSELAATATPTAPEPMTLTAATTEKELAAAEKFTSVFKPIDLYFPLNEANYIKTPDTEKFFAEATKYLANHNDKTLVLTGHTDNTGSADGNLRLSRERANDVKGKLRRSGIGAGQITVRAKGETEPKADNKTAAGRKANRRVTVVVQ